MLLIRLLPMTLDDPLRALEWRRALRESAAAETRALIASLVGTASKRMAAATALLCQSLCALPDTIIAYQLVLSPIRAALLQALAMGRLQQYIFDRKRT